VPFTSVHAGKIQDRRQNAKHSKTPNLLWFSRLLRHLARKRHGLILQWSRAHTAAIPHEDVWWCVYRPTHTWV